MMSYLHTRCKHGMCEDCINIAEEYQLLHEARATTLIEAEERIKRMQSELNALRREAERWEQVARAGLPDIIEAWTENNINKILIK